MTTAPTVIDVRDNTWTPYTSNGMYDQLIDWARSHGLNPDVVYRVEIHPDRMTARVHELATDEHGNRIPDDDGEDYAQREPYDVALTSLPPLPESAPE